MMKIEISKDKAQKKKCTYEEDKSEAGCLSEANKSISINFNKSKL